MSSKPHLPASASRRNLPPPSSNPSARFSTDKNDDINGHNHSKENGRGAEGGEGGGEGEDDLPYLNYVTCCLCRDRFIDTAGPEGKGKAFFMTSCGHILCSAEEHNHKKGVCTACKKSMTMVEIAQSSLLPAQEMWFQDPNMVTARVNAEIKSTLANLMEKADTAAKIHKFQYKDMQRTIQHLVTVNKEKDAEIVRLRDELEQSTNDIQDLKESIATFEAEHAGCSASVPPHNRRVPHAHQIGQGGGYPTPRYDNQMLRPVPEDVELNAYVDANQQRATDTHNYTIENAFEVQQGDSRMNKRPRANILDQQPQPFVPQTPSAPTRSGPTRLSEQDQLMATAIRGYQPPKVNQSSRIQGRSVGVYEPSPAAYVAQNGGVKSKLEQFRFDRSSLKAPATPQPYTQGYIPQRRATPLPRSVSAGPTHHHYDYAGQQTINFDGPPIAGGFSNDQYQTPVQHHQASRQPYSHQINTDHQPQQVQEYQMPREEMQRYQPQDQYAYQQRQDIESRPPVTLAYARQEGRGRDRF
ncbi:hypothetical protein CI109_104946 [Kwoniella shandongensis]|uniref:RING-type domain-containing protein n=1 Tax=Kwoniella shandongensis TaxID=1734106 RepID=A0AAJ8MYA4_9TREE